MEEERAHRVLVVDDAEDLRMLLRLRMEARNGLTVVGEAADGVAAVELASELQPDLVLLDLAMPRMDGLEALPLIRAAVPGVRVVVLSGFNQSTLADKAIEAGADQYVVKGGSMRELLDLVESMLATGLLKGAGYGRAHEWRPAAARGHPGRPRCGRRARRGATHPGAGDRPPAPPRGRGVARGPAGRRGAGGLGQAEAEADADILDGDVSGEVGGARTGRLMAPDEGSHEDVDAEMTAEDEGIDGAGASAEEAAMHTIEDDPSRPA